jgi:Flp pilus assembly protein TadD
MNSPKRLGTVALFILSLSTLASAQRGIRGQVFLPNGSPLQQQVRFSLESANGMRVEYYYTDSNGRIILPPIVGWFTITVETDSQTYDTTTARFNMENSQYITVHLRPLTKKPEPPPGVINVNDVDREVAPKAKEAYEEALTLLRQEQYEQAIEPLKQAIKLQPNYFHAYNDLGVAYMKLNKLDLAIDALQHAIKINDNIYLPHLNLAIVYNKQNRHKEAADVLVKLQRRFADLEKIHLPLIEALMGAQDWPRAEQAVKRALALRDVDTVDLKTKLGVTLIKQSKFKDAVAVLREATDAEPDNALAQFNYGAALMQTSNLDEAEAALLRAYKIEGAKMAGAQMLLGMVYSQKQNAQKAIEAFETYLRDLPDAPNAAQVKEAIARLRKGVKKQ